jgi:hypothetical protein
MDRKLFGSLLTAGIKRVGLEREMSLSAVQDEIGYLLGRNGSRGVNSLYHWRRGHIPAQIHDVEILSEHLIRWARMDRSWHTEFLAAGGHPDVESFLNRFFTTLPTATETFSAPQNPYGTPLANDQPQYIMRQGVDNRFLDALRKGTSIIHCHGSRQLGKSSLLIRGKQAARDLGARIIDIDFDSMDLADRANLDSLLQFISKAIVRKLDLPESLLSSIWDDRLRNSKQKFHRLLRDYVLIDQQKTILMIDDADHILGGGYESEFFSMIRAVSGYQSRESIWRNFQIVLSISVAAGMLISNRNSSPFTVGAEIVLRDFLLEEVQQLNRLLASPIANDEVYRLHALTAGHPALCMEALHLLRDSEIWTLDALLSDSYERFGSPFHTYLEAFAQRIEGMPDVKKCISSRFTRNKCQEDALHLLLSWGLVVLARGKHLWRCKLYELFFEHRFGV